MIKNYFFEARNTLVLGAPFVVNQLLQVSVATVDSMMAGADGELTLAAVAQGAALWMLAQLIIIGIAMSLTPTIARAFSKGDNKQLRTLFQQGLWLAVPLSVLGIVLMCCSPYLMTIVSVRTVIIAPATDYLLIMAIAMPFFCFYLPIRYFNEGIGNPKVIMFITALSIPVNILGNYIFLNGLLGLPKMGAAGIAIASVISIIFMMTVGFFYMTKSNHIKQWRLFVKWSVPIPEIIVRLVKIGTPNSVALLMEAGMFSAIVLLSGRLGVNAAAANQIAFNYTSTTFMIPLGISMALMTRIGMAVMHDDMARVRIIGVSGIVLGALSMMISVLVIICLGHWVARLYTDEQAVLDMASTLLALAAIFQIPDGIQICAAGALRGLEETQSPMRYAIVGYWLLAMPLAVFLAFYMGWGSSGLWTGLIVGLTVAAILLTRRFWQLTQVKETTQ